MRRRLLWFVAAAVVVVGIVHSPLARRLAARQLERSASKLLDGSVSIGRLDYALWAASCEMERVELRNERLSGSVATLRAGWSPADGLAVELVRPELRVGGAGQSQRNAQGNPRPWVSLLGLGAVAVVDGALQLELASASLELTGIGVGLAREGDELGGTIAVTNAAVRRGGETWQLGDIGLSADVSLRADRLVVEQFAARAPGVEMDAEADLASLSPLIGSTEVATRAELDALPGALGVAPLRGAAEVLLAARAMRDDEARGRAQVSSPGLWWHNVGPLRIEAKATADGRGVAIEDFVVDGYSGILSGTLSWPFASSSRGASFDVADLSLGPLARDLGWPMKPAARLSGTGELRFPETGAPEGEASLRLSPAPGDGPVLAGEILLGGNAERASLETKDLVIGHASLSGALVLSARGTLTDGSIAGAAHMATRGATVLGQAVELSGNLDAAGPIEEMVLEAAVELRTAGGLSLPLLIHASGSSITWSTDRDQRAPVRAAGRFEAEEGTFEATLASDELSFAELGLTGPNGSALGGSIRLEGSAEGDVATPSARLTLETADLSLGQVALPDLRATLTSEAGLAHFEVTGLSRLLEGTLGLTAPYPLRAELDLGAVPLGEAAQLLGGGEAAIALEASGRVRVEADLANLSEAQVTAEVGHLGGGWGDFAFLTDPFNFDATRDLLHLDGFRAVSGEAALEIRGDIPLGDAALFDAKVEGRAALASLLPMLPLDELSGALDVDLRVSGPLAHPNLDGVAAVAGGAGRFGAVEWSGLDARARLDREGLHLEQAQTQTLGGRLTVRGDWPLFANFGPLRIEAQAERVDVGPLLAQAEEGEEQLGIVVSGSASLSAPRLQIASLTGSGSVTELSARAGGRALQLEQPVGWRLDDEGLTHSAARLAGATTTIGARVSLRREPFQWSAALQGSVGGELLETLLPRGFGARISAAATVAVEARGDLDGFELSGEGRIDDGRLSLRDPSVTLEGLSGRIVMNDDGIQLEEWRASVGDGRVEASGTVRFEAGGIAPEAADIRVAAKDVPLSSQAGMRGRVSGELRLSGTDGAFRVGGDVRLARGLFSREIDYANESLSQVEWKLRNLSKERSLADHVRLAIDVQTSGPMRVENGMADLKADARLNVGGTLRAPTISGVVSARERGILRLGRARTRIEQGRLELNGYPLEPPVVTMAGKARIRGINIEMRAEGTPENLQMTLEAPDNPELTQGDLATLIVTGRTAAAASSEGGAIAAEMLAASLGDALQKGLGDEVFIDVSTNQSLFEDDRDPNTRFGIGRSLSQDFVLLYSTALDGSSRRWVVDFRPRGQFRVRATAEDDNSLTIELSHRVGFHLRRESRDGREEAPPLAAIHFSGDNPIGEAEARRIIGLKAGKRYDFWKASRGADALAQELRMRSYLDATVAFDSREQAGGLVAVFEVSPGRPVEFEWSGDDPGDKLRRRAIGSWNRDLPAAAQIEELAREARRLLQADRHFLAQVEATERDVDSVRAVELHVRRGPRGSGVDVAFEGNERLDSETLVALLPKPGSLDFFSWLDGRADPLRRAVRLRHAAEGMLGVTVAEPRLTFDAHTGVLSAGIRIDEGPTTIVGAIDLPDEARAAVEAGELQLTLREDVPFRIQDYVDDRAALTAFYQRLGYLEAEIAARLQPTDERVDVTFAANPGDRAVAGALRVAEPGRTREAAIAALMRTQPGARVRPADIAESRRRLFETRAFRSVEVRPDPATGEDGKRDVIVGLVDKPDLELSYGLRYTTEGSGEVGASPSARTGDALQLGGRVEVPNPFGRMHRYTGFAYFGADRDVYGLGFESPMFLGRWLRTELFLYEDGDDEPEISELTSNTRTFTFQQTHRWRDDLEAQRWNDRLSLQWSYSFSRVRLNPTIEGLMPFATNRGSLATSLIGDSRDSFTDPRRGLFWSATAAGFDELLGSDVSFVRLYGQLFWYVPLGSRVVWASGYRLGVIPGTNEFLILTDRFRTGGPSTVRGFEHNTLGPSLEAPDGEVIPIGGQAMAVFNQELRFPLFWRFDGGAFYDAGNVFRLAEDFSLGDLRHNVGLGLRLRTPVGPIRFDYAWVLDPQPGEKKTRLVFSFGHAF